MCYSSSSFPPLHWKWKMNVWFPLSPTQVISYPPTGTHLSIHLLRDLKIQEHTKRLTNEQWWWRDHIIRESNQTDFPGMMFKDPGKNPRYIVVINGNPFNHHQPIPFALVSLARRDARRGKLNIRWWMDGWGGVRTSPLMLNYSFQKRAALGGNGVNFTLN